MQENRQKQLRNIYISRINCVIDYIEEHIDAELTLEELAGVAQFSPFHFHRIFRAIVGEPLNAFIQRIRLEKAAIKLLGNPAKSITEIAYECGFSGSSTFARAFKDMFGVSASRWRDEGWQQGSKNDQMLSNICQVERKTGQEFAVSFTYNGPAVQLWRVEMTDNSLTTQVEVKDMPEIPVAYVRYIGPYKGDVELFGRLFGKLMTWAGPRNLLRFPETKVMAIYHDDPAITDVSRLRTDACISVPADTIPEGEIGRETIPAGKYAIAHFEINVDQYEDAWKAVCGGWLPESGYQPGEGLCYELYYNDPKEHPEGKHIVDICIPVKPL